MITLSIFAERRPRQSETSSLDLSKSWLWRSLLEDFPKGGKAPKDFILLTRASTCSLDFIGAGRIQYSSSKRVQPGAPSLPASVSAPASPASGPEPVCSPEPQTSSVPQTLPEAQSSLITGPAPVSSVPNPSMDPVVQCYNTVTIADNLEHFICLLVIVCSSHIS